MNNKITIRQSSPTDLESIMHIVKFAFGGDIEAQLTAELLNNATAEPVLSLLAFENEKPIDIYYLQESILRINKNSHSCIFWLHYL